MTAHRSSAKRDRRLLRTCVATLVLSASGAVGWPVLFSDPPQPEPTRVVGVADGPPLTTRPVGSVVPFVLRPDEIEDLAPTWLPANGETVRLEGSPLHGQQLPDLLAWSVNGAPVILTAAPHRAHARPRMDHQSGSARVRDSDSPAAGTPAPAAPSGRPGLFLVATRTHELSPRHHPLGPTTDRPPPRKSLIYMVKIR